MPSDTSDAGLVRAFKEIDVDGSGAITGDEFQEYLAKKLGKSIDPQTLADMIKVRRITDLPLGSLASLEAVANARRRTPTAMARWTWGSSRSS